MRLLRDGLSQCLFWESLLQLGLLWTLAEHGHFSLVCVLCLHSLHWVASCAQTQILIYLSTVPYKLCESGQFLCASAWWLFNISVLTLALWIQRWEKDAIWQSWIWNGNSLVAVMLHLPFLDFKKMHVYLSIYLCPWACLSLWKSPTEVDRERHQKHWNLSRRTLWVTLWVLGMSPEPMLLTAEASHQTSKLFFKIILLLNCCLSSVWVCVCEWRCPWWSEVVEVPLVLGSKGIVISSAGYWHWEPNWGPLQAQHALLPAGTPLWPLSWILIQWKGYWLVKITNKKWIRRRHTFP